MRLSRSLFACTALIGGLSFGMNAVAQTPAAPASAPTINPNQVIATVNDQKITIADLMRAKEMLPPQAKQLQSNVLLPLLATQLVDQKAVQAVAEKENLGKNPEVKAAMKAAADNVLINAYLKAQVEPKITDAAVKAYYQSHYVSKKPEKEVHARHILVNSEAQAKDLIQRINKGEDFAKAASLASSDKATATNGGDLGWFKAGDMQATFSKAVFAMEPGSVSSTPVHTEYGWHVIQVLGARTAPTPSFEQVQNNIRRDMVREEIKKTVEAAAKKVKVTYYDGKGKPVVNPASKQNGAH